MEHKYHYGYDHKSKSCIIANIFASGFTIKFHHVKKKKKKKKRNILVFSHFQAVIRKKTFLHALCSPSFDFKAVRAIEKVNKRNDAIFRSVAGTLHTGLYLEKRI